MLFLLSFAGLGFLSIYPPLLIDVGCAGGSRHDNFARKTLRSLSSHFQLSNSRPWFCFRRASFYPNRDRGTAKVTPKSSCPKQNYRLRHFRVSKWGAILVHVLLFFLRRSLILSTSDDTAFLQKLAVDIAEPRRTVSEKLERTRAATGRVLYDRCS